jgi:hypothetical protein
MKQEDDAATLAQEEILPFLATDVIPHPWFPALQHSKSDTREHTWFCALVPIDKIPVFVKDSSGWDFSIGDGSPSVWESFGEDAKQGYEPFGNEQGIEPIVISRSFHHNRPSSVELSQEFRLYHNLYDDQKNRRFLKSDDDGNESAAARYTESSMEIRTDLLLEFCAAKQMALAIYVNGFAYSKKTLEELGLSPGREDKSGDFFEYTYWIHPWQPFSDDDRKTISRANGKKYVLPGPMPVTRPQKREEFQKFIVDTDPSGASIRKSCDPEAEANPDGAHYLTPVFFRAEVLAKYYGEPEKYEVEDGHIRCSGMWGLRVDNDNDDYVVVWLGDLGRDLTENERSYWASFNIPPDGRKISKTCYTRAIRAWFCEPQKSDLVFKSEYRMFREDFKKAMGWDFFLELHDADEYCYRVLHTPLTENGAEFDSQLINLTKLLVDSLNEKEIAKELTTLENGDQGIVKLRKFFEEKGLQELKVHIDFLRELQGLRSTSAAHRKGSRYERLIEEINLVDQGYVKIFNVLLDRARDFLSTLRQVFLIPPRDGPSELWDGPSEAAE